MHHSGQLAPFLFDRLKKTSYGQQRLVAIRACKLALQAANIEHHFLAYAVEK